MSSKRGAIHVDWAVSMGIFIVFIIGILVFLKPGGLPVYTSDFLTGIVEDGVLGNTSQEVELVPLSFTLPSSCNQACTKLQIEFDKAEDFPFCSSSLEEDTFSVISEDGSPVNYDYKSVDEDDCVENKDLRLRIGSLVEGNTYNLLLVHSGFDYSASSGDIDNCSDSNCEKVKNDDNILTLGIRSVERGLSEDFLSETLDSIDKDYDAVKGSYNYPLSRDFRVCVEDLSDCYPSDLTVPPDVDVFSRSISAVTIDEFGGLSGRVNLIIQAW